MNGGLNEDESSKSWVVKPMGHIHLESIDTSCLCLSIVFFCEWCVWSVLFSMPMS